MASPRTTFPIAEGLGLFIGIVAWDLLAEGHIEIVKAILIAVPSTIIWFGLRFWKNRTRNRRN